MELIWLIPALPVAGFVLLAALGRRIGEPRAGAIATLAVAGSFVASVAIVFTLAQEPEGSRQITQTLWTWIPADSFQVSFGLLADELSLMMCLFITGVGALIHVYSIGYMKGDPEYARFFTYLNLFVASMLLLVLGDNLILTFLGWEGVGACSYLLISFWFTEPANATAGKKAFVTNRIGDFGYMLGTFLVFVTFGTIDFLQIDAAAPGVSSGTATVIALLFFLAATGKSAQLPLFVWLPDAMAGPTPVSALIHAATMVTSGVFLLTRLSPILEAAGWANDLIAWVGAVTALLAAGAAVAQNDIKKVLAYSTVSQLGFMFIAIGSQNYVGALFHMITHAFFKALLFLGAGAVIYSMAHEQDMRRYGQLRRYLPVTFATMFIGWLAISGIPPFSGFWSKDEILAGSFQVKPAGQLLWVVGIIAAVLTAFYMTRLMIMTFAGGTEKWRTAAPESLPEAPTGSDDHADGAAADHPAPAHGAHDDHHLTPDHTPREPSALMLGPLVVLAAFAAVAGLLNLPFADQLHFLDHWVEPVLEGQSGLPPAAVQWVLALVSIAGASFGVLFSWRVYQRHRVDPAKIEQPVFAHAWYIDDSYAEVVGGPGEAAFQGVADFDHNVVDGAVRGVGGVTVRAGEITRRLQTGFVRSYAFGIGAGALAVVVFAVVRMSL
ncbi:MAG: NADH-quinone oxidoreductase subunit L [Actinobacteria bacterium]|nr:NADH-quinone oxidoreductase subunit L [Actinomycetota bacterium]